MTPREQRLTRKKWKTYSSNYRQKKQLLKQIAQNLICPNTPSATDDEMQLKVSEKHIVNENRRGKEAKKKSEIQRKFRKKQLIKMEATVSKLRTK